MRKLFCMLAFFACLALCGSIAYAGTFSLLASTGRLRLDDGQAWSETYNTTRGTFKIEFKNRSNASSKQKYRLTIWWDGKEIANGYSPDIDGGYRFEIFREETTDRIFVSFETLERIVIMGYDPIARKLHKYIESGDYSSAPTPQFFVNRNNELMLSYASVGGAPPTLFNFKWNEKKAWFDYREITKKKPPTPKPKPTPAPKPIDTGNATDGTEGASTDYDANDVYTDYTDYAEPEPEETYVSVPTTVSANELFYEAEEEEVVIQPRG